MGHNLHKQSIRKKSLQFSLFTAISRILGFLREYFKIQLFGVSPLSDAFLVAIRIPASLRKVFAEGALSAAFVPVFVRLTKENKQEDAERLMSLSFIFFEGIILLLTLFVWSYPEAVINVVASGLTKQQLLPAITFLRILFPLIFFLSSGALFAGALQSVNHFFMTAFAPVVLNIIVIASLISCIYLKLPVEFLCYGFLIGGFIPLILYLYFYKYKYKFGFKLPDQEAFKNFKTILVKFSGCLLAVGVMEINLIVDGNIGSYLPAGSITLLFYGNRFMQIPLSLIATSFSTVLLSHCSRVALYAPKRLNVYLLEASKVVVWATLPASLFTMFISSNLFTSLMASKVTPDKIFQASVLLIIMSCGLLFFSINKILTSIFYSLGNTRAPAFCGAVGTIANLIGNLLSLFLLGSYAIYGIALSTVFFGIVMSVTSYIFLYRWYGYKFYAANFFKFLFRYLIQLSLVITFFLIVYSFFYFLLFNTAYYRFFYFGVGYWFIVFPLFTLCMWILMKTRSSFGINLYFLNK